MKKSLKCSIKHMMLHVLIFMAKNISFSEIVKGGLDKLTITEKDFKRISTQICLSFFTKFHEKS